jgi:spore coat protein U-like protein
LSILSFLLLLPADARAACAISVAGVAFGSYDVFATSPDDSAGSIVFECDKQAKRIRITLSAGSSGSYATRAMQGTDTLSYNLYVWNFSTVWGDGTEGTSYYWNNNPPNDRPVTVTIYGRIPALQDVRPGTYTDTVHVQIDF